MKIENRKIGIFQKIISLLTVFSFLLTNISFALPDNNKTSTLRAMSLVASGADRGLISSFQSTKDPVDALDDGTLADILKRVLEKAGMVQGKDVVVGYNSTSFGDESRINIAQVIPSDFGPWTLQIHQDFHADYGNIMGNDVVLKVNFGDGVTRNISVARGLAYRALGGEFQWRGKLGGHGRKPEGFGRIDKVEYEDEASKAGVRYRIVDSAIWIWYHYIYKNRDKSARENNLFASEMLDEFFEIVNNPEDIEQLRRIYVVLDALRKDAKVTSTKADRNKRCKAMEEEIKEKTNVGRFRDQIPFLLNNTQLQQQVKQIILLINAKFYKLADVPAEVDLSEAAVPQQQPLSDNGGMKKPDALVASRIPEETLIANAISTLKVKRGIDISSKDIKRTQAVEGSVAILTTVQQLFVVSHNNKITQYGNVNAFELSPDGNFIAVRDENYNLSVCDLITDKPTEIQNVDARGGFEWTLDGKAIIVIDSAGTRQTIPMQPVASESLSANNNTGKIGDLSAENVDPAIEAILSQTPSISQLSPARKYLVHYSHTAAVVYKDLVGAGDAVKGKPLIQFRIEDGDMIENVIFREALGEIKFELSRNGVMTKTMLFSLRTGQMTSKWGLVKPLSANGGEFTKVDGALGASIIPSMLINLDIPGDILETFDYNFSLQEKPFTAEEFLSSFKTMVFHRYEQDRLPKTSKQKIEEYLKILRDNGILVRTQRGLYKMTNKGIEEINKLTVAAMLKEKHFYEELAATIISLWKYSALSIPQRVSGLRWERDLKVSQTTREIVLRVIQKMLATDAAKQFLRSPYFKKLPSEIREYMLQTARKADGISAKEVLARLQALKKLAQKNETTIEGVEFTGQLRPYTIDEAIERMKGHAAGNDTQPYCFLGNPELSLELGEKSLTIKVHLLGPLEIGRTAPAKTPAENTFNDLISIIENEDENYETNDIIAAIQKISAIASSLNGSQVDEIVNLLVGDWGMLSDVNAISLAAAKALSREQFQIRLSTDEDAYRLKILKAHKPRKPLSGNGFAKKSGDLGVGEEEQIKSLLSELGLTRLEVLGMMEQRNLESLQTSEETMQITSLLPFLQQIASEISTENIYRLYLDMMQQSEGLNSEELRESATFKKSYDRLQQVLSILVKSSTFKKLPIITKAFQVKKGDIIVTSIRNSFMPEGEGHLHIQAGRPRWKDWDDDLIRQCQFRCIGNVSGLKPEASRKRPLSANGNAKKPGGLGVRNDSKRPSVRVIQGFNVWKIGEDGNYFEITDFGAAVTQLVVNGKPVIWQRENGNMVRQENSTLATPGSIPLMLPVNGRTVGGNMMTQTGRSVNVLNSPLTRKIPDGLGGEHAIHGFTDKVQWHKEQVDANYIKLSLTSREVAMNIEGAATLADIIGDVRWEQTYHMQNGVLTSTLKTTNLSEETVVLGGGYHPYYQLEDPEDWTIQIPSDEFWATGSKPLDINAKPNKTAGTEWDFRTPQPLRYGLELTLSGLKPDENRNIVIILRNSKTKEERRITFKKEDFPAILLWVPTKDNAPAPGVFSVEPLFTIPNGRNMYMQGNRNVPVCVLKSGESRTAIWQLQFGQTASAPLSANGNAKKPGDLGAGEKFEREFNTAIAKSLELSSAIAATDGEFTKLKQLMLEPSFNRSQQIVITMPDIYLFNPGLKEFAELVKDEKTLSDKPLFRFVVSVDSYLPASKVLKGLENAISAEHIIQAKIKVIEALNIPGLETQTIEGVSCADNPVEATQKLIEALNVANGKITDRPKVIMFQYPRQEIASSARQQLLQLAKAKNIFIFIPQTAQKNQVFNVQSLITLAFKQGNISEDAILNGGICVIQLPKAESLEFADTMQEFCRTLLAAFECA